MDKKQLEGKEQPKERKGQSNFLGARSRKAKRDKEIAKLLKK